MATQNINPYNPGTITLGSGTTTVTMPVYDNITEQTATGYVSAAGYTSLKSLRKEFTQDDIAPAGELLHNILQDAMITCEEDCCQDFFSKIDFTELGQALVRTIIGEYLISNSDKEILEKEIRENKKLIARLDKALKELTSEGAQAQHDKKLADFKSRKYPPSFKESSTYSTNSNAVHSPHSNKDK